MNKTFQKLDVRQQQHILDASASVFAERGYAATVEEICKKAKISNGALYKYFRNKEALFKTVVQYGIEIVQGMYKQYYGNESSPYDLFHRIFKGIGPLVKKHSAYVSIYLDLGTTSMNRFAGLFSQKLENVGRDFIAGMLEQYVLQGEIDNSIDMPSAVYCIDTMIVLYAYSFVSEHYRLRLDGFLGLQGGKKITNSLRISFMMKTVETILSINIAKT